MTFKPKDAKVAYFSMEIALEPEMPTYSGGLGMLAGDTLRSAADLGVPVVGVMPLHRKGYFQQRLDAKGLQTEQPESWSPDQTLAAVEPEVEVIIEGRKVAVRAWRYDVKGVSGFRLPVILLDTDLPQNSDWDRKLTDQLYGGDVHYRLCQEAVLGLAGEAMLAAMGFSGLLKYHMNEGHSALLVLALVERALEGKPLASVGPEILAGIRPRCIFTTHTPVPAGHDRFSRDLVLRVLGQERAAALEKIGGYHEGELNLTWLALRGSDYINGVAMQHGEVSQGMFPNYPISAITNGVHSGTWVSPPMGELYDRHVPAWRRDDNYLRYVKAIPVAEIRQAHTQAKLELFEAIRAATGRVLDPSLMTLGFARRASAYKRADLLFHSLDRLRWIARNVGRFQLIFGGKAHPRDDAGKWIIQEVFEAARELQDEIPFVYLENYDMNWGRLITSGVDLWLNTPKIPQEASGTSGMKAALNGVPSLSVLDGWWVEGCIEGVTGWSIGHGRELNEDRASEALSLYDKLESIILPMFYGRPLTFAEVMRSAIAINGAFFNTRRMVYQYVDNAYFPDVQIRQAITGWNGA